MNSVIFKNTYIELLNQVIYFENLGAKRTSVIIEEDIKEIIIRQHLISVEEKQYKAAAAASATISSVTDITASSNSEVVRPTTSTATN